MTPKSRPRTVGALREYYLRANKDAPLVGPLTYYEAENQARIQTREAARQLTFGEVNQADISIELVQILGTREGDPVSIEPHVVVLCVYLAGRKTQSGALAAYNSSKSNT